MAITLKADARTEHSRSEIRQLRDKGKVPGVIYGKKAGNTVISIDRKELLGLLRQNPHAIIEMELPDGGRQPVMINELQRDKVNRELLHVDFHQISMDEPVKTVVALEFVGEAAGVQEGGIVQVQNHEIEIRCLPNRIPTSIQVDITHLGLGDNLLVSDLKVSADIEIKSDANELIVTVLVPQKEEPDQDAAAEAESAKAPEGQEETV